MPIDNQQELMVITAEECAELAQVCTKIIRFGMNDEYKPKKEWLTEEAGDVLCMLKLLTESGLISWDDIEAQSNIKRDKLKKWSSLRIEG